MKSLNKSYGMSMAGRNLFGRSMINNAGN